VLQLSAINIKKFYKNGSLHRAVVRVILIGRNVTKEASVAGVSFATSEKDG